MKTFTIENPTNANPPESKVWFNVVISRGRVVGLEEHDGYSGGPIGKKEDDLEALFIKRVLARGGDGVTARSFLEKAALSEEIQRLRDELLANQKRTNAVVESIKELRGQVGDFLRVVDFNGPIPTLEERSQSTEAQLQRALSEQYNKTGRIRKAGWELWRQVDQAINR